MQKNVCYHTAIYLRLSREDGDMNCGAKRESDSISSQRALACSFVREQPDMELFDLYIDDGYSGANFDRPDFKRMLDELGLAKDGKTVADYYYHGVSHQLGLDTHDISCSDYEILEPGMIITVEPGFYIEEEEIGIRIENDILITEGKAVDLSKGILKTTEDIEAWMSKRD